MTRYEIIKNSYIYYLYSYNGTVVNSEIDYWNGLEIIDVLIVCMVFNYGFRKLPK